MLQNRAEYLARSVLSRTLCDELRFGISSFTVRLRVFFCDEINVQDAATLLRVYTQAAGEWERHVGRKLLEVAPTKKVCPKPLDLAPGSIKTSQRGTQVGRILLAASSVYNKAKGTKAVQFANFPDPRKFSHQEFS
jgi:hypothetical protein